MNTIMFNSCSFWRIWFNTACKPILKQVSPYDEPSQYFKYGCFEALRDEWWIIAEFNPLLNDMELEVTTFNIPRRNWRWLLWYYKRARRINVRLWLLDCVNECSLNTRLQEMKECLKNPNQTLEFFLCWNKLLAKAYVENLTFENVEWCKSYAELTFDFVINDPFISEEFRWSSSEFWYNSVVSWSILNFNIDNTWYAESLPKVTINLLPWSATITEIKLKVNNTQIIVNWVFNTLDVIQFDAEKNDVLINWIWWQDYIWAFWELTAWPWNIVLVEMDDDYIADVLVEYKINYQ